MRVLVLLGNKVVQGVGSVRFKPLLCSCSVRSQSRKFPYFPTKALQPSKEVKAYGYVLLAFPVGFFLLGCWQVQRRQWKKDLLKRLKERYHGPAMELPENLKECENMEFCRFRVRGTFDHDGEFVIPMRMRKDPEFTDRRYHFLVDEHSPVGVHVVTPFIVKDRPYKILVNRGWVPNQYADPKTRAEGQVSGEVELVGVNRLSEKKPPFALENNPFRDLWFYRDVEAMAKFHNAAPVYLEADFSRHSAFWPGIDVSPSLTGSTVNGGPIGGQTNVQISDNHTAYIFTWWTLCGLTTYLWLSMFYF